jgi:Fibronectin type III domain
VSVLGETRREADPTRYLEALRDHWLLVAVMVVGAVGFATASPDTTPPSTPTGLAASNVTQTSLTLTWNTSSDNIDVTGYDVYRNGTKMATVTATSSNQTGLTCGTSYTLAVEAFDAAGNRSSRATVTATTAACLTTDTGATGYRTLVQPPFTPTRTVVATTPAQFTAALADLQAGDKLIVRAMTITGKATVSKALASPAEIHFDPGVQFTGTAVGSALPAIWIVGAKNIRLYGGDLTNPGGGAILVYDSTNVLWWHFKAHDAAGGCLSVFNINSGSSGLDFDGELSRCGLDLSYDPHAEKGTGQHGSYIGGGNTAYTVANSRFSLYVHDQPYGAAVQAGSNISSSEFWVKAVNVTFNAQSQVAGNALQLWANNTGAGNQGLKNLTVHKVTGENLAGRVVEVCCLAGSSGIVVEYGRGINTMTNPKLNGSTFAPDPAVTYQNVVLP